MALLIASVGLYGCGGSETDSGESGTANRSIPSDLFAQDRTAPTTPTGLAGAAVSPSQINLNWSDSRDNMGVTGYRIYRGGVLLTTLGSATTYQDTGLTLSTTYSYTVQAIDGAGNASGQSTAAIVTTPAALDTTAPSTPAGLTATAVSASRINLSWSASTDNVAVTGYRVFRNGVLLITLGNVTAYQDNGLNAPATYVYAVQALDAAGNASGLSAAASATTQVAIDTTPPSTPTNLAANVVSTSQVNLSWSASTDNDVVANYRVYRNSALLVVVATTSYQDTSLSASTMYSYNVDAVDATGNVSGLSAAANATTPATDTAAPSTPIGVTANAISSSRIDLSWLASIDNVAVTGYLVFRGGTFLTTLGNVTTYQDAGLAAATTYSYRVHAFDGAGNVSGQSAARSATTLAASDTTAPTTPNGLTATAFSASRINLSWSASTDNVAVTAYRVYRNGVFLAALGSITAYQDSGLTASTAYTYNIDAVDAAGNASGISTAAGATTLAPNTATLEWDAVTFPTLSGYRVYYGTAPGSYQQPPGAGVDVGNVTNFTVAGLGSGTRYYFAVTAYDGSNNESGYSNEVFKDIP